MLREVLEALDLQPGDCAVDATAGFGGHAVEMARVLGPEGFLLGLDRDPEAAVAARERLAGAGAECVIVEAPFSRLGEVAARHLPRPPQGILWDLGVSSPQLDQAERGFSFMREGPLDMRMDPSDDTTAADLVNQRSAEDLQDIFSRYGEERYSGRIARRIVERRRTRPCCSTRELAELIEGSVPGGRRARIHPATRVFQALRIAVNAELDELETGLEEGLRLLAPGSRAVVLAYHSLEDRIVKQRFRAADARRDDPSREITLELLTRRPLRPCPEEAEANPRSRSARLRAARKV